MWHAVFYAQLLSMCSLMFAAIITIANPKLTCLHAVLLSHIVGPCCMQAHNPHLGLRPSPAVGHRPDFPCSTSLWLSPRSLSCCGSYFAACQALLGGPCIGDHPFVPYHMSRNYPNLNMRCSATDSDIPMFTSVLLTHMSTFVPLSLSAIAMSPQPIWDSEIPSVKSN